MDFKTVREQARDLLYHCESPVEALLLWMVQLPTPWTLVAVVCWISGAVVLGAWLAS